MSKRQQQQPHGFDAAPAADLIGKHALVGLTYCDADGTPVDLVQVHGRIIDADETKVTLRLHESDEEFTLPPDFAAFAEAPPGEYRLRATGEVVVDPDLLATWTITAPPGEAGRGEGDDGPPGPGNNTAS